METGDIIKLLELIKTAESYGYVLSATNKEHIIGSEMKIEIVLKKTK